ncbi:hypothetical protein Q8A73_016292 [Channa argus]|nr:hypothetical protein Q8A73_016292 [Channa argus]
MDTDAAVLGRWKVEYKERHICALKGSSVTMVCSFYHPHYLRVNRVMWGHVKLHRLKGRLIFDSRSRKNPTRFQYVDGPKNTSVFVSSVTDVGNNITLVCSSQSNPPVENYTWFKVDDENIVEVGHEPVFLPGDGDQYLCSVSNKHGSQNSSVVTLKNKGYWATFSRDVVGASAAIAVILIVTTVIAVSRVNKNRKWARQTDSEKDAKKTDYINWVVCDRDPSHQKTQCEGETAELTYATIYFTNESRPNMRQQVDSHDDHEDVIYSTVCRSTPISDKTKVWKTCGNEVSESVPVNCRSGFSFAQRRDVLRP